MIHGNDGASHPAPRSLAETPPPHNLEAERGAIGSVLIDNGFLPDVLAVLPSAGSFYRGTHAVIWRHVQSLHAAGTAVDAVTVFDSLEAAGEARDAGGEDTLAEIVQSVPHAANAVYYAQIVRQKATLRGVIETLSDGTREAYSNRFTADQVLARALDRLKGIDRADADNCLRAGEIVDEVLDRIDARRQGEMFGVPTGFAELDRLTDGFQPEDLVLVAARPSMGKTALSLNIAASVAVDLLMPTLFVSLEMGNPLLVERVLSARSGVKLKTLRTGQPMCEAEYAGLGAATAELRAAPLYLLRRPSRVLSEVVNECRRYHARHGVKLIVIDYLQLIHGDNPRDSEVQALTKVSAALKGLAREVGAPVVALSQLSRNIEGRPRDDRRPRLSDLRGSGTLEQDADLVLFLHRPEQADPSDRVGEADAVLAKNRNGPTGDFPLVFEKEFTRFRDFAPPAAPPRPAF